MGAEEAVDEQGSAAERAAGRRPTPERSDSSGRSRAARESAFAGVARDMAIGALAGAVIGGAWRMARTLQPESAEAAKANVTEAAREIGVAAAVAVRDVLTSKPVNELMMVKSGDGDRTEVVKTTLRDAVAAAGDAARGVLESKGGGSAGRG